MGSRVRLALLLAVLLVVAGIFFAPSRRASDPPPDVLLVIVDTLRADRLPAYGYADAKTPALDRLAREGVVFERAVAASGATLPSHASMFTSRWVRQHSIGFSNGGTVLGDEATLAEQFHKAGYATAAFVSNIMLNRHTGLSRGFDVYDDELRVPEQNRPDYFERPARATTQRAIRWLQQRTDRPVFLVVHYQDPHGPYTPPPGRWSNSPAANEQEKRLPVNTTQSGFEGIPAYQALPGLDRPSQYESRYVGEIEFMDQWLGRLLRAFDRHRPDAGRVVLFTSDHGESLGEEDHWFEHGHTSTPDVSHVPFLLKAPGIAAGRADQEVSHVDVLPTLLELAGLPAPPGVAGIALGPYLRSGRASPERTLFCDLGFETAAYRDGEFLRIQFPSTQAGDRGAVAKADARRYAWSGKNGWALESASTVVDRETRAYFSQLAPRNEIETATVPADRLRALGYLDPDGTAPAPDRRSRAERASSSSGSSSSARR
jgi:arylsulfatase A-like enzyme